MVALRCDIDAKRYFYWAKRECWDICVFKIAWPDGEAEWLPRFDGGNPLLAGFDWGPGADDEPMGRLALAILHDYFANAQKALALCDAFRREIVARLPRAEFTLTDRLIAAWLERHSAETIPQKAEKEPTNA